MGGSNLEQNLRFTKVYGYVLISFFIITVASLYIYLSAELSPIHHRYIGIVIAIWYLVTGIGILSMRRWGYYLFKFFLYILFLAFPIGTIISYRSLKYIKDNNIRDLYFFKSI